MRILVVHNAYQQKGGEDVVVCNEVAMLRANGHDVREYVVSNHSINGFLGKVCAFVATVYSWKSYKAIRAMLISQRPDVVHVHNFFPLISPSVFYACHRLGVPSVFTLHNFRILCPTALLMHKTVVTERSLRGGPWWAVPKRVYRRSLLGTFVLASMIEVHRIAGTWRKRVTRFIALTEFAKGKFAEAGVPIERLVVKPNFIDAPKPADNKRSGLLFVGRLTEEKGVEVLVEAARSIVGQGKILKIVGGGPLADCIRDIPLLEAMGELDTKAVYEQMASAHALVMPSVWYEGFPMVLVEAYANGLPVIASRLGALAELVEDRVTGLLVEPGSSVDLARKIKWALENPDEMANMGRAARARYEARYTARENYMRLIAIYEDAMAVMKRGAATSL